jgi:hypothetical protein
MHSTTPEFIPQLGVHSITAWAEWKEFVNYVLNMHESYISRALQGILHVALYKKARQYCTGGRLNYDNHCRRCA